jgi:RHS repeat-associated protein
MEGLSKQTNPLYSYLYNSIEKNIDFGLNLYTAKYRTLDVTTGRWYQIDPMVEAFEGWSPYNSNLNNPIRYEDKDGDCPRCFKVIIKTAIKSVAKGKLDLGEVYDMYDSAKTLLSKDATLLERGEAVFNLVSPVSTKDVKAASKAVGMVDDAKDAGKAVDKAAEVKLLPEKAGPVANISPSEVINKTPAEIDDRAKQLGLEGKGTDPKSGKGAYIDPQTGQQRILSHPNATHQGQPNPHGHVNNVNGSRIDQNSKVVPPESKEAHLPIKNN